MTEGFVCTDSGCCCYEPGLVDWEHHGVLHRGGDVGTLHPVQRITSLLRAGRAFQGTVRTHFVVNQELN
jgi:hypothetical protein